VVAFSSVADPLEDGKTYGMALEAAVFRNLRFAIAGSERSLAYLRDAKGSYEVDFLVQENGRATVLIELTKDRDPRKKLATITDALQKTKARRAIVVHGGLEEKRSGDVWLAPAERFLLAPAEWIGGK
jgi:predicted AAA+ superfamily ATPase